MASRLAEEFSLVHFQVGSQGRNEHAFARAVRLLASPVLLAFAILGRRAALVHVNTALNARAYWRDLAYTVVAKLCGARVIYQVHGGASPERFFGRSRLLAAFLRATLELPDAIVVLASVELEAYRAFVQGQQVLLLPNGVDPLQTVTLAPEKRDPSAPLRLVYIGRLAREKGLYDALPALKLARAGGVDARLVVAGSGPDEPRLRRFAATLGLASQVSFAGPLFGEDKARLLGAADALLLPSRAEALPYALLEAMAAGVPVIASAVGAIPDVVVDGVHGALVPPRDPQAIARAIVKLAADPDLLARAGSACRRRIALGYSIDRLAGQFCGLYSELCSAKRMKALSRF